MFRLLDAPVSIVVGSEERIFTMHSGLLCSVSGYFTAALKGNFKEAAEQRIAFPEDQPWVFERFQLWLYSKHILDEGETTSSLNVDKLVALYAFAEARCIPMLQNHLVDLFITKIEKGKKAVLPKYGSAYSAVATSSPLRKLVVDLAAHRGSFDYTWTLDECPKEYLVDLIRVYHGLRDTKKVKRFQDLRCEYHIHAEGEPRCSGKPAVK